MSIDETRWLMHHFDGDRLECQAIRFTIDILKTLVVIAFGVGVALLLG